MRKFLKYTFIVVSFVNPVAIYLGLELKKKVSELEEAQDRGKIQATVISFLEAALTQCHEGRQANESGE